MTQRNNDSVYITRLSKFLPNDPVSNDQMEEYLGIVEGTPSKAKPIILRNNQIKTRYYALDKEGNATHSNTDMTVEAIKGLLDDQFTSEDIEILACGTTSPDQLLPSHTSMVHGKLMKKPVEIISPAGSCASGMHAMHYGYLSILAGQSRNAVSAGSEKFSSWMLAKNFKKEPDKRAEIEKEPIVAFEKDFLRWMLSDGAGAALLSPEPNKEGPSLRIDWIESKSFANQLDTCMYAGGEKYGNGEFKGWRDYEPEEILEKTLLSLRQDVDLLGENIVPVGNSFFLDIAKRRNISIKDINWFLPHLSSEYFRSRIEEELISANIPIPQEKWFTNLSRLGNVGAASIYFMLEELFHSENLKKGDTILCMVPESARFSYVYLMLTAV
jgi:3-oxoacyl-[acyl-carrier-protein] synthase-3